MAEKILLVDDDPNILASSKRSLGRKFSITTAEGGVVALECIRRDGPFAVVLSDMRMPVMDGIEFICAARKVAKDTVYMMLTGNADQETAMNAVNKGQIFRFLTKPCPAEIIGETLKAGINQYRLVTAERDLLNKTLMGSIKVLVEVLELVQPKAFNRGRRIKPIVKSMVAELGLEQSWQYEIAAMLSQIGCIVLPPDTVEKLFSGRKLSSKEQEMYATHPANGRKLLEHIPRLERAAHMIEHQLDHYVSTDKSDSQAKDDVVVLGAQILHAAIDFDSHMGHGLGRHIALSQMKENNNEYNPKLLNMLERISIPGIDDAPNGLIKELSVGKLTVGMFAHEDILTSTGILLVPKGHEITQPLIVRLRNFAGGVGIEEPIQILVPQNPLAEAA